MRYIPLAIVLLMTLSAHTCNKKTAEAAGGVEKMSSLVDTKWMLQTLKGNALELPAGAEVPWIELKSADNSIEGFGGCNQLMGKIQIDGDNVLFPSLGSTKKYCESTMKLETTFMGVLRKSDKFKLSDNVLTLLSEGSPVATFTSK